MRFSDDQVKQLQQIIHQEIKSELKLELKIQLKSELKTQLKSELKSQLKVELAPIKRDIRSIKKDLNWVIGRSDFSLSV